MIFWTYDGYGNRTSQTTTGTPSEPAPSSQSWSYPSKNQATTLSYDSSGAGFVIGDASNQYAYDPEGRLCAVYNPTLVEYTEYVYDAEGSRVAKGMTNSLMCNPTANYTQKESYVLGPSGEHITELGGSGAFVRSHVYANGQLLATYVNNSPEFAFNDWLGSKRVVANSDGSVAGACINLPFGDELICSGSVTLDGHHFTGQIHDSESGNDYFGARYYSDNTGRFLSPDPLGMAFADPSDPQSLNLYSYVLNNPLIFSDPNGLDCVYTNNQSRDSVDVTIIRGDCINRGGKDDNGIFVDGTVDANNLHYSVDRSTGASSLGYDFTNSDDDSKSGAGVISLANLAPLNTDGQLAPSIQNQFVPRLAATSAAFNRALPVPCGAGFNSAANLGRFRYGFDASTNKGVRFLASGRLLRNDTGSTSVSMKGFSFSGSQSIRIPDTPFSLSAGTKGGGITSLGINAAVDKDLGQVGFYIPTGNMQDGCQVH